MQFDFNDSPGTMDAIIAVTDYQEGHYEGHGEAITLEFLDDKYMVRVYNLSHCSCYGPLDNKVSEYLNLNDYLNNHDNAIIVSVEPKLRLKFDELLQQFLKKDTNLTNPLQFSCPQCNSHDLEEILTNVTVSSKITNIGEDSLQYGDQTNESGNVERYQCANCGYVLPNVTTHDELIQFIKDNTHIPLQDIVGKTIQSIEHTQVDGNYGKEPCIVLHFTDNTKHGFVIQNNE